MIKPLTKKRKLGPQGNLTLPKIYRELLDLQPGDEVNVIFDNGKLIIEPREEN